MNLIIDVGNSLVKLAVFKGDKLEYKEVVELPFIIKHIQAVKHKFVDVKNAIISSVGRLDEDDLKAIKEHFDLLILNSDVKLPYRSLYKTSKTLGVDRMALVSASVKHYPAYNVLVIDAGTCITYDFVTEAGDYLGGAISPGIRMRYKSLHNLTANLPLLDTNLPNDIIGNSTEQSMHSGVVYGVLKEIDGLIEAYKANYPDLTVILTGGDSNFLSKQLKSSIFATPNFLLEGLNFILQFNTNE